MKKNFIFLGIIAILFTACESDSPGITPNKRKDIQLTRSEQEMTALGNKFAFNFFNQINKTEEKENFLISPLSASIALSMTANGAAGKTLEEMKSTLDFADYSLEEMNEYYQKLILALPDADSSTELGLANSIWIKQGFNVKQPFINTNKEMYSAEVRTLDFGDSQTADIINKWCSDHTNKRITKVLDHVDPAARLFLINALYFKGIWVNKFDKKNTKQEKFSAETGEKTVDMMHQECAMPYTEDNGIQIVEMPYGNEAFSMVILLPEENKMESLMNSLTVENWNNWLEKLTSRQLDLKLPKFKLEYGKDLIEEFQDMGMKLPFDANNADFSLMSDNDLYIGLLKQDAFIEVNEEGTEAAAVTTVGMFENAVGPGRPTIIPFHVNRPFVYIIKEKSTGVILFMGKAGSV